MPPCLGAEPLVVCQVSICESGIGKLVITDIS